MACRQFCRSGGGPIGSPASALGAGRRWVTIDANVLRRKESQEAGERGTQEAVVSVGRVSLLPGYAAGPTPQARCRPSYFKTCPSLDRGPEAER